MGRMPLRDTGPELALRRELHRRGQRYRIHDRALPGTPDVAFSRAKLAVFVDGCFWHCCPHHGVVPKNNREWWRSKLDANVKRDRRKDDQLVEAGWVAIHVWEHENPTAAADRIEEIWTARTDRRGVTDAIIYSQTQT